MFLLQFNEQLISPFITVVLLIIVGVFLIYYFVSDNRLDVADMSDEQKIEYLNKDIRLLSLPLFPENNEIDREEIYCLKITTKIKKLFKFF